MRPTFVSVLNTRSLFSHHTTGKFDRRDVEILKQMLRRNLRCTFNFVCLSDCDVPGVDTISLKKGWPGWWAKIEVFRQDFEGNPVIYLDLDTILVADFADMLDRISGFTMLRDFKRPERYASGVMAWRSKYTYLFEAFRNDPERYMEIYSDEPKLGDQAFIEDHLGIQPDVLQDLWPGAVESYKVHVRRRWLRRPGRNARIVCFHGDPGPKDVNHAWVRRAMGQ